MTTEYKPIPYTYSPDYSNAERISRARDFYNFMDQRRSVRYFANKDVPLEVIESALLTAGTSPSGAHQQPWTFVVVRDKKIKQKIREAAEQEEKLSYETRMTEEWLNALAPLGTDWHKPFLEIAPYLIVVFRQKFGYTSDGKKKKHYYSTESVGIAVGFLIAALHNAGLATLTHTPSPMKFLTEILKRPENESPFVLLPVGYPADNATVPDIKRKSLDEIMVMI